jgi:hypothetical protein
VRLANVFDWIVVNLLLSKTNHVNDDKFLNALDAIEDILLLYKYKYGNDDRPLKTFDCNLVNHG